MNYLWTLDKKMAFLSTCHLCFHLLGDNRLHLMLLMALNCFNIYIYIYNILYL